MSQVVYVEPEVPVAAPPYNVGPNTPATVIANLGTKTCTSCGSAFFPGTRVTIEDGEDVGDASTWTAPACYPSCITY